MTQLYRLDCDAAQIAAHFGVRPGEDPWAGGYVTPGKFAPVLTAGREFIAGPRPAGGRLQPRLVPRLWGVSPPPSSADQTRRIAHACGFSDQAHLTRLFKRFTGQTPRQYRAEI